MSVSAATTSSFPQAFPSVAMRAILLAALLALTAFAVGEPDVPVYRHNVGADEIEKIIAGLFKLDSAVVANLKKILYE